MSHILLVEDDEFEAQTLSRYLEKAGNTVVTARSGEDALATLRTELVDVAVVDLNLPGLSGVDLIKALHQADGPPIIVVTGTTEISTVVSTIRAGAADFVAKPLTMKALEHVLERVVEQARLKRRVERLERQVNESDPDPDETTRSPAMKRLLAQARRFAESEATTVLLVGESGAGKEVLASYIHRASRRASQPLVRINVAAIPETMMEAELFGSVRGAFTDARRDRAGFFSAADRGTLLLDEIGELRPELQAKLLRAIETRRFYPVGGTRELTSDVRIVAATNRDPKEAVESGRLRADLYYRLATMVLRVPPLRERTEDIAPLANAILARARRTTRHGPASFDAAALRALEEYPWPGNVRELRNSIERVAILVDTPTATVDDLEACGIFDAPPEVPRREPRKESASDSGMSRPALPATARDAEEHSLERVARDAADQAERRRILAVLEETGGNRTRAAEILKISRSTLWGKLRRHGIDSE